jgi:hypothetical protein
MGLLRWFAGRRPARGIDTSTARKDRQIVDLQRRVTRVEGDVRVIRSRLKMDNGVGGDRA